MTAPIGEYAIVGNLRCAALVSRAGSIDWFCPGKFDEPACFSALLGHPEHGRWLIAPRDKQANIERRYQPDTLVLETCFATSSGQVKIIDAMPVDAECHVLRLVQCTAGKVPMQMQCLPRHYYGRDKFKAESVRDGTRVVFERDDHRLQLSVEGTRLTLDEGGAHADFVVSEGEQVAFALSCASSGRSVPAAPDIQQALSECAKWWRDWISRCVHQSRWQESVKRSLITLKAMTYEPDGGMVAAVTTSLPEVPGGEANYDYRFCWLRDAAFALKVLLNAGFQKEACAWRDWLIEAMHQHDGHLHALYTVEATVAPEEEELHWLPGYLDSRPVRLGNAASHQYQLDVRGELIEVLHLARSHDLELSDDIWQLQCSILDELEERWREPDTGIWEFRTMCEHLTHSKVLAWVACDRSIKDAERFSLTAPLDRWRRLRDEIRADILKNGVDPKGNYFTQHYGSSEVDASLLMIPLVGFLPADDPRMLATIAVIERDLCEDGLVRRYRVGDQANIEGMFLACCFWLADNYWLAGRRQEAQALFERLLGLCNDVGLLAEEYDVHTRQLLGNFPQGLSHLALVSTARLIATSDEEEVSLS